MAAGLPVVQPSLGAFPEIIGESGGGICYSPNSPEALANALSEVLSDREKTRVLSNQARKSMEERFNIHGLAKGMSDIYERVAKAYQGQPLTLSDDLV
jgi:glycosyltransferase involved in cell wall biosynthesis